MCPGYQVVRLPLHQTGKASGEDEDFVAGFVLDDYVRPFENRERWGAPAVRLPEGKRWASPKTFCACSAAISFRSNCSLRPCFQSLPLVF